MHGYISVGRTPAQILTASVTKVGVGHPGFALSKARGNKTTHVLYPKFSLQLFAREQSLRHG